MKTTKYEQNLVNALVCTANRLAISIAECLGLINTHTMMCQLPPEEESTRLGIALLVIAKKLSSYGVSAELFDKVMESTQKSERCKEAFMALHESSFDFESFMSHCDSIYCSKH